MPVKIRCPKCGSTMTYLRLTKDEMVCRKCGYTGKPDEFKTEEAGKEENADANS